MNRKPSAQFQPYYGCDLLSFFLLNEILHITYYRENWNALFQANVAGTSLYNNQLLKNCTDVKLIVKYLKHYTNIKEIKNQ